MNQQTNDDVRRAAENLREMVGASVDLENGSVECVRDMWIVAQDHPYLAQQREEVAGATSDLQGLPVVERRNAMLHRRRNSSVLPVLVQLYCLLLSGIIGITLGLLLVILLMPDHPMIDDLRAALHSFLGRAGA